ncbi:MAG: polyprenol monophosphomannose synthase [Bacteroidales bacterium]|jgi:dolichol-phosphate mannosyltransferase|nr:polyprenol monophosphomannose synthase [Bacteroidales bacterium]
MANLVIIPTYNEKENISQLVTAISSLPVAFDILVIDDNSPDGTGALVKEMIPSFPNLHLVERPGKMGLGRAYIAGFDWALQRDYKYIFEMDADFSHNPADLVRLFEACDRDGADLAIGSRYISGVNVVNWPLGRVLMSYIASIYVRVITGMHIKDTTAGFKCYRREVLRSINPGHIKSVGYGFQIEMKFTAWILGYRIVEIPIIFTDRKEGTSKMTGGIFNEALWGVLRMKIISLFRKPRRVEE